MDQEKSDNQIVETLHTTSHSERVGTSLKSSSTFIQQTTALTVPTTSCSSMDSTQRIVGPGFPPTQIPKPEHVTQTTQGLRRLLAMNIVFQVGAVPNHAPVADNGQGTRSNWERMKLEEIPVWCYIFASFFTWIMLAGFLVLPSSFSDLEEIQTDSGELRKVLQVIRNIPLYVPYSPLISITKER